MERLGLNSIRLPLTPAEAFPVLTEPFVLVVPTFGREDATAVPKPVTKFLEMGDHSSLIRGVIAGGNRNFGETFALAGKIISANLNVPCLYRFEMAGTLEDAEKVRQGLERFWKQ